VVCDIKIKLAIARYRNSLIDAVWMNIIWPR